MVPGLIDCHTHLAFAGWRADEMEERIRGRSYQQIAAAGGGIARTVAATREASSETLVASCAGSAARDGAAGRHNGRSEERLRAGLHNELRLLEVYEHAADGLNPSASSPRSLRRTSFRRSTRRGGPSTSRWCAMS